MDEGTTKAITSQLMSQLSSLHTQGVVHRDIKPENVLINHQGKARLADFGVSQKANTAFAQQGPDALKFSGSTGTPNYIAPETFHSQTYSQKADCWSMGMILSELLTGERPPYLYQDIEHQGKKYKQFDQRQYANFTQKIWNNPKLSQNAKHAILSMINLDPRARPSAEQAKTLPFFQTDNTKPQGGHFKLQSEHQQLARFEQMLENAEARQQAKPNQATAREIDVLERQISVTGTEVKSLLVSVRKKPFPIWQ